MTLRTLLYVGLVAAACRPTGTTDLPICTAEVAGEKAVEASSQTLPFDVWLSILVRNFDRGALQAPDGARTCGGQELVADWAGVTPRGLPPRPRLEADLTFGEDLSKQILVWARLAEYDNGEAMGPVALARWVEQGLEIRGIGVLVAPARRATLRLETIEGGEQVLIVEGDRCPVDAANKCHHEAQILRLDQQRFVDLGLREGTDAPTRTRIQLDGMHEVSLAGGGCVGLT